MAQERLKRSELEILQKEEQALIEIIAKYEDGLNKLKVEELTIRSELGRAQDKDLHSRNNTPISVGNTSRPESANTGSPIALTAQSLQMFRSLSDREALEISAQPSATDGSTSHSVITTTTNATVNQSTLNLGTALIQTSQEEEEIDSDEENEIFPSYNSLQYKMFQEKIIAEKTIPANKRINLELKVEQLEEEELLENNITNRENRIKEEPKEQDNDVLNSDDIHVVHDKSSKGSNKSEKLTIDL